MDKSKINIIDLFSGAGGLTEGFRNNDFEIICHIEMDESACLSLKTRDAFYYLKNNNRLNIYENYLAGEITREQLYESIPDSILKKTINTEISEGVLNNIFSNIEDLLEGKSVQGIIGGPPCQAYSTIGRARNKETKDSDKRIYLYEYYIKFLKKFEPSFFIFENVKGLLSFQDHLGELLFPKIKTAFSEAGYLIEDEILKASDYGVSQNRERLFIFGHKINDSEPKFFEQLRKKTEVPITIYELFSDLPKLNAGEEKNNYEMNLVNNKYISKYIRKHNDLPLTQNISRNHTKQDLEIYKIVAEERKKGNSIKYNNLPSELQSHENKTAFLDRFKCVNGDGFSHTVVAHISKDGHYFIHPDVEQNRSITVRESARIQSFSDDFFFEGSRTSKFKQIGNAVPPVLSLKLAETIKTIYNDAQ